MKDGLAPILIFGYGNPSRGDDALGPKLIERLEQRKARGALSDLDLLTDFQLQVEHALDLQGRERVIFVDAGISFEGPFRLTPAHPAEDSSYTTHAMSPSAVLRVLELMTGAQPPPCELLAIRGYGFALGAPLSDRAAKNLDLAERFLLQAFRVSSNLDQVVETTER